MTPTRPDPDELLTRLRADERRAARGKLKVFFGYAAGVGKTYAMLDAARRERAAGREVVVGYVEPHGRAETESLLAGLEALPARPSSTAASSCGSSTWTPPWPADRT
jgi:two-component system, OmpR family, sensor histidine kinase KdpD